MVFLFCPICEKGKEVTSQDELGAIACESCKAENEYWRWLAKTHEIRARKLAEEKKLVEIVPSEGWKRDKLKMEGKLAEIVNKAGEAVPPEVSEEEEMEKKRPVGKSWISLGQTYGISITEWPNGITLIKRKKDESGNWYDLQSFNLSPRVMTELFIRIPSWFEKIKMLEKAERE